MRDRDGLADDYVLKVLDSLAETLDRLAVVCIGRLEQSGLERLSRYTEDVFVLDAGTSGPEAFRQALISLLGWEKVLAYDELVLADDSFYGPLCPFRAVFDRMGQRPETDFWGITAQYPQADRRDGGVLPFHLDGYFLVFRENLLHSAAFRGFWEAPAGSGEAGEGTDPALAYEVRLTRRFTEAGFRCGAYVDAPEFTSERVPNNYRYPLWNSYELAAEHGCPVVSREVFTAPQTVALAGGENPARTLAYVDRHTGYDADLIRRHLLRLCNVADLREALHLCYVLPCRAENPGGGVPCEKKAALILHLFYPELLDECFRYIRQVPAGIDLYATTSEPGMKKRVEERFEALGRPGCRVLLTENRGREIASLLVGCRELLPRYEYVGFVHDKRTIRNDGPQAIGRSFMYLMWENLLKSPEYIGNILRTFEENPLLGLLAPPEPYHAWYFGIRGNEWTACFRRTEMLAKELHLRCNLSEEKPPFALSTSFWCRTAALKALFAHPFRYEDFPPEPLKPDGTLNHAVERILPYVAQHEGYLSGTVMNDEYASLQSVSYESLLSGILAEYRRRNVVTDYEGCVGDFGSERLLEFCRTHARIYICCVDVLGKAYGEVLLGRGVSFDGFIVPDEMPRGTLLGRPLRSLAELDDPPEDCGLILALSPQNQASILPVLRRNGFCHTYSPA